MSFLRKLEERKKLLLILLLLLLLAIVFPPLGRLLVGLAIVGLIAYLVFTFFPEILSSIFRSGKSSQTVRKYVDRDIVNRKPILLEAGLGEVLCKLNSTWFQIILVEEPLPDEVERELRLLDKVVLVSLKGNREFIVVRDSDPEQVIDYSRLVESLLRSSGVRFRILNPEEAINVFLSLFRT